MVLDIHARPAANALRMRFYHRSKAHLPPVLHGLLFDQMGLTKENRRRWRAVQCLAALGRLAKAALLELTRLLYTNFWHSSIKESAYALDGRK